MSAIPARSSTTFNRIWALVLRYTYVLRSSWPRVIELAYWPTVQMIMWGFMSQFLANQNSVAAQIGGALISAVLLWDVLFRGQLGVSVTFFEEMWSRNLGHLFVSPLRPGEFATALVTMSLIRTLLGMVPASLLAIALFGFSVYSIGLSLVAFFFSLLMFGWDRPGHFRYGAALRAGRGEHRLGRGVCADADQRRLLSLGDPAGLAAEHRALPAAGLCLRGHALDFAAPGGPL